MTESGIAELNKQKNNSEAGMRYYLIILVVLLIGLSAPAATHYVVPPGTVGTPTDPYTDWDTAGTNIIQVVNAALTNTGTKLVLVTNGTYYLTNYIYINNGLTLRSFNSGTTDVAGTVLNGNYPTTTNCLIYMHHAGAVVLLMVLRSRMGMLH